MATDRSYRQLKNIQDDDFSDEENNAFAPLAGHQQQQSSGGGGTTTFRGGKRSQSTVRSCGRSRSTCIVFMALILVLAIAVVSSFARPRCSRDVGSTTNIYTTVAQHTTKPPPINPTPSPWPWNSVRLPTDVIPTSYRIFLHPNLTTYDVTGSVIINATVQNPTKLLVLHAKNMTFSKVEVLDASKQNIPLDKYVLNEKLEQADIVFVNEIKNGKIEICINFTYVLNDGLAGFYRSTYVDENGVTKTIATTQFEASDARAAFPCFDEPGFKATFKLNMVREPQYHTLFNMPLVNTTSSSDNLEMDVFEKSFEMSTYLVAFVVSEFENKTSTIRDGLKIGVHAPGRQIDEMDLAFEVLNKTIQFYEDYFGFAYPLPKQDMVAIPDFAAGAMENWGLITYRQVDVLYKEHVTTLQQQQRISIVVTHELAHQWFGNLVTMKWWNDLWLNEGFASYVEYVGTDNWNKDWHMMDQFILYATHTAMAMDCLQSSHPISVNVQEPSQIAAVFDAISYDKGACIIRMLQAYLGKEKFLTGLKQYLNNHAYGNADSDDLWKALSNQDDGGEVKKMMDTWTIQQGYPVVNMSRDNEKNITVSQKQFLLKDGYTPGKKSLWVIPLTYTDDSGEEYSTVIQNDDQDSNIEIASSVKWFKGNLGQAGFYRVNYNDDNWNSLSDQLWTDHTVFTPADRASLIDDAHYLARAGMLDYSITLNLGSYIAKDEDYVPITTLLSRFRYIGVMLQKTGDYNLYRKYMWQILTTWKNKLNWNETKEDSHLTKFLRVSVLSLAVELGHESAIAEAIDIFNDWKNNNMSFDVNLKYPVYCAAARNGFESDWEFLWDRYQKTKVVSEKTVIMSALGCTRDISIINRYLDSVFDDSVRLQDIGQVIGSVAANPIGARPAWLFLMENWDTFLQKLGSTSFSFGNIISSCTSSIASNIEYREAKQFFDDHSDAGSGTREISKALEKMEINVKWLTKNKRIIREWFFSQMN
ncbi:glutamyl aminopeptidase-like [Antedon mediterranea]|uniref:glutamyl aminopeptidase-like n=1 Tax=Antedon mediterranea TaxID=105859 RepID=UPI003AF471C1